jgi:hypothetical protein
MHIILFILTANVFVPGGTGTTIRHNTQKTHITQNNPPHSNKTQHTKLKNNKGHILHAISTITIHIHLKDRYNYNTDTLTIQIQLQYKYNYNTDTFTI